ncbi:hypothetical protein VTK56DRAFT_7207 [Thermocarpiscus australiensis]
MSAPRRKHGTAEPSFETARAGVPQNLPAPDTAMSLAACHPHNLTAHQNGDPVVQGLQSTEYTVWKKKKWWQQL